MADPLTAAAEQLAPPRASTSFFSNPGAASTLTRYYTSGREFDAAKEAASAATALEQSRFNRAEQGRRATIFERDEQENRDRDAARAARKDVIATIAADFKPGTPDFLKRVTEFQAQQPPEVLEDPTIKDIMSAYLHRHDAMEMERKQKDLMTTRTNLNTKAGIIPKEEYDALPGITDDQGNPTGEKDPIELARAIGRHEALQEVTERKSKYDESLKLYEEKQKIKNALAPVDPNKLTPTDRAAEKSMNLHLGDESLFTPKMEKIVAEIRQRRKAAGKPDIPMDEDTLKVNVETYGLGDQYREAQNWDNKDWILTAKKMDKPAFMDYVADNRNLSADQRKAVSLVWDTARKVYKTSDELKSAAPTPGKKPLTASDAAKFKEQAKGNRAEAERLAREAGFDF